MNQENWQKAKQIFNDALKLSATERRKFLDEVCRDNADLGEQIKILLESYESGFLEESAVHKVAEIISSTSLKVEQQIGRYLIKENIGVGGMGEVFLAEDTELKRLVAIKVLHAEVAEDKERISRFIQEARAASALNHPNILTIHEIGKFEDSRFIVSEYVKGETLREKLKRENLSPEESLKITIQIATALQAAHEAGIVHRDIKPENIMLRNDGLVKVLDFGLAKLTEIKPDSLNLESSTLAQVHTSPGVVMGTIAYMSPEQARGVAIDARTDIWSLGVVLYEMLSGKMPFPGETTSDIIASILKTEADPFENLDKEIPREIEAICFKSLEKEPENRYQTTQELLQDLRKAKKNLESKDEQTASKKFSFANEQNTELIRHRPTVSVEYVVTGIKRHRFLAFGVFALLTVFGVGLAVYKFIAAPRLSESSFGSSQRLNITPLVTSSKVSTDVPFSTAISPDGKYATYLTSNGGRWSMGGKWSIRLRQIATTSDVEIVPPTESILGGMSFTSDGNYIYYLQLAKEGNTLFKVPVLGGEPTKITGNIENDAVLTSAAAESPDGKTIVFSRDSKNTRFVQIANSDGTNERTIIKFTDPNQIYGAFAWSPDGKTVAFGLGTKEKDGLHVKLFGINVSDGSQHQLNESVWSDINGIVWLADGNLIVSGKKKPDMEFTPSQLWIIAPNAPPQPITNDRYGYKTVSVTAKGDVILTMQSKTPRNLWIVTDNEALSAKQITSSGEIVGSPIWMSDGKVTFSSIANGNLDIWTMNQDGSNRKQLTANQGSNILSEVTTDGRYIIFTRRNSFGYNEYTSNIWRMDSDGSNQKQLTNGDDVNPKTSPDGKWVYYIDRTSGNANIYKIPIDGGTPVKLATTMLPSAITVSPQSGMVAYINGEDWWKGGSNKLVILSPNDNKPIKTLPLPRTASYGVAQWTLDETAIAFTDSRNSGANIWTIPFNGQGESRPLTNFTTEQTFGYDWSPDGRQLLLSRGANTSEAVLITKAK